MLTIESVLKILNKYGYDSINTHPYIYNKGNNIGINYSYIDDTYGLLERVALFNNEIDLDLFLKKYQWYKKNNNEKIKMILNDYEVAQPQVYYINNNHVMTDNEIFNHNKKVNGKISYKKRLLMEIENLIDRYYLKKEELERTINNYKNKQNELKRYYLELQTLINKYNHNKWNINYEVEIANFKIIDKSIDEVNLKLLKFKNEDRNIDDINSLLFETWELNKQLELNNEYIESLTYENNLENEMILVNKKIKYMNNLLSKKRLFKENLITVFNKMDDKYDDKYFNENEIIDNYTNYINKKYDVIDKINHLRLTEYLNDFISNKEIEILKNIERCKHAINKQKDDYSTKHDKILEYLTKEFNNNLSIKERSALILYTSLYHEIFDMIMSINNYKDYSIKELIKKLKDNINFKKVYDFSYNYISNIINLDCNKKIKKEIFSVIDFKNRETFIDSIRKCIKIISNINNKMILKDNMKLFVAAKEIDNNKDSFIFSSSNISQITLNRYNTEIIVCNVKKGINVLFSPFYLKLPNENAYNKSIELLDELNPFFIFDTKDIGITNKNDKIFLSKYKSHLVNKEGYSYVDNFKIEYKIGINEVIIEKNNKNNHK